MNLNIVWLHLGDGSGAPKRGTGATHVELHHLYHGRGALYVVASAVKRQTLANDGKFALRIGSLVGQMDKLGRLSAALRHAEIQPHPLLLAIRLLKHFQRHAFGEIRNMRGGLRHVRRRADVRRCLHQVPREEDPFGHRRPRSERRGIAVEQQVNRLQHKGLWRIFFPGLEPRGLVRARQNAVRQLTCVDRGCVTCCGHRNASHVI
mmetsp:Transcript_4457/g.12613  ORF Transcript_4457/g.12613 Transcript_4457/m.12613 type:complete len:206 (+) Transcript_4457:859-1476(+)